MRAVIQRVDNAHVEIDLKTYSSINHGLMILVGIEIGDDFEDVDWLCSKLVNLRIFEDETGKMNKSIVEVDGNMLLISQFTLFGQTKKGNRPSFIRAARPEIAIPLYEKIKEELCIKLGKTIQSGVFGADMKVSLTNNGPVTILMDSKNKE